MLSSAPVALRCTRMSFERASLVKGTRAPDFAILVLLSSETGGRNLRSGDMAGGNALTVCSQVSYASHGVTLHFDIWAEHLANERLETSKLHDEQLVVS